MSWPQIFQPGGTESEPAAALGVIVPPLMILVDRQGKVATVTTTIDEIKAALPGLLADKKGRLAQFEEPSRSLSTADTHRHDAVAHLSANHFVGKGPHQARARSCRTGGQ